MDRRGFMKDVTQVGISLGVTGLLLDTTAPLAATKAQQGISKPHQEGDNHGPPESSLASTSVISLDGEWLLVTDPRNLGQEQKWFVHPSPDAKPARVPGIFQEVFPAYHGVVWYWREFTPPAHPHLQGRYLLRFGAVDYLGEAWLNGVSVGRHKGSETPFVLDVTDAVRPQVSNLLAVRVLKPGDTPIDGYVLREIPHRNEVVDYVPGSSFDFGGIVEPVDLLLPPAVRVENVFVRPDWKTGDIHLQANIRNATQKGTRGHLQLAVAPASTGTTLLAGRIEKDLSAGDTLIEVQLPVHGHRLWDLNDPYLYRVTVRLSADGVEGFDETSVRSGFRDFRVEKGYFRLNGKRIFLRSTHTGNHCPIGQTLPPAGASDFLRLDMLYAKASGFNMVRFISGMAHPYQLDLCDEIGLLVYEESLAAWLLADSPKMKERYESSVREMVLRDRNHPSVAMWGMLNETREGPVFSEAVSALPLVRSLDDSRLVLLSSGRWDGRLGIGSVSNPGSTQWDHVWGNEAPGAPSVATEHLEDYWMKTGDIHFYPQVPQSSETDHDLRTLGHDSKPVFLSEYGIGSTMDVIHEARMYEQLGVRPGIEDYVIVRSMADKLIADWKRFGMESVYAFPEYFLRDSQARMARHRLLGFNAIRSNPKICGFNLTGMLDHALTGEGVWRYWRDWKPGVMDVMQDGWAPLRWCLFVRPTHTYVRRPVKLEGVLANEDVLRPGEYPVRFRVCGPAGIAWERAATIHVPTLPQGEDGPLAIPVMAEEVALDGPEGDYGLTVYIEQGAAATEASWQFHLTDPSRLPRPEQRVTLWGIPANVQSWLKTHGVSGEEFLGAPPGRREIILVGKLSRAQNNAEGWKELARRMARGSTAVFLSHEAFQRENDAVGWLPLARKGRCYRFSDWLYHKECVAKAHPVFEGLQCRGILDWYYYGPVIPHYLFDGQETPSDVIAAAFAAGYSTPGGYASGILLGAYRFGEGQFIVNTFPVLEQLDRHPAADRILLNLVRYCSDFTGKPPAELPTNFDDRLRSIGYLR
jgi:hypothetical protein